MGENSEATWCVLGAERVFENAGWQRVESRLQELGVPFHCAATTDVSQIQSAIDSAIDRGLTRFAAAGGDGTANLLVNALCQHPWDEPPTVGLLPLGTGCDFVRSFDLPRDSVAAAERLSDAHSPGEQLCDVGLAEGSWGKRYFLNVATLGVTAAAVRRASMLRWLGEARYLFGFWTVLPTFRTRRFDFQCDTQSDSCAGTQAVIANARFFGNGFEVGPQASTNDGQLDVMMVAANRWQLLRVFQQVRKAEHVHSPRLIVSRATQLTIDCGIPTPVEVDGEFLGVTPAAFSVLPSAIKIRT